MRNKYGIHIGNTRNRNWGTLLDMGVHNYTALHHNMDRVAEVRQEYSNALILVRFYHPAWSDLDPRWWAERTAEIYHNQVKQHTRHVTPANEMNLEHESGGATQEWYRRINEWLLAYIDRFRQLAPDAVVHWPALAFGHGEREYGYEILSDSLAAYDVVDYHPYWFSLEQLFGPEAEFYAFRFDHDHRNFFPDKEVFISECGNFDVGRSTTPVEMVYFFERLYDYPYVLGATPFIWDSGDEHAHNVWQHNMEIANTVSRIPKKIAFQSDEEYDDMERLTPVITRWKNKLGLYEDEAREDEDREGWQRLYDRRGLETIDLAVIHHTASALGDRTPDEYTDIIARWHVRRRQWPGTAYHYIVYPSGEVHWTGSAATVRYHAGNQVANRTGVGIALVGNFQNQEPTEAALAATEKLLNRLDSIIGRKLRVEPHSAVRDGYTACPGANLSKWMDYLRGR